MQKDKRLLIILSALAVIFSVLSFFALINYNVLYYNLGKYTIFAFLFFPLLSLVIFIFSSTLIFKKGKISFITPVAIALIGCILAFVLSNDASLSKIESDYLKNENQLNYHITQLSDKKIGVYELNDDKLKWIIPENKVQIESIGNNKKVYFFIALNAEDRYEGYVYAPYGLPEIWDAFGQFSEPLDLDKAWYYMILPKGDLIK